MKIKRYEDEHQRGRTCVVEVNNEQYLPGDTSWRPVIGDEFEIDDGGGGKHWRIWESIRVYGCQVRSADGQIETPKGGEPHVT